MAGMGNKEKPRVPAADALSWAVAGWDLGVAPGEAAAFPAGSPGRQRTSDVLWLLTQAVTEWLPGGAC